MSSTKHKRGVVPTLTAEEEAFLSAISAPENAHIFSLEAVSKAYAHTKRLSTDMTEPHQRTAPPPRAVPVFTAEQEALWAAISAPENAHIFSLEAVSKAFAHVDISEYTDMTEPHQRTRALLKTRYFLEELTSARDTPRVPKAVRESARQLLRDYPGFDEIEAAHIALPEVFGPVVQRQAEGMPAPDAAFEGTLSDDETATPELVRKNAKARGGKSDD